MSSGYFIFVFIQLRSEVCKYKYVPPIRCLPELSLCVEVYFSNSQQSGKGRFLPTLFQNGSWLYFKEFNMLSNFVNLSALIFLNCLIILVIDHYLRWNYSKSFHLGARGENITPNIFLVQFLKN